MIIRLLFLLLIFTACTNGNKATDTENDSSATTEISQESDSAVQIQVNSYELALQLLEQNQYPDIKFNDEQRTEILKQLKLYTLEQMNADIEVRKNIRTNIFDNIMTSDQQATVKKSMRQPVIIQ